MINFKLKENKLLKVCKLIPQTLYIQIKNTIAWVVFEDKTKTFLQMDYVCLEEEYTDGLLSSLQTFIIVRISGNDSLFQLVEGGRNFVIGNPIAQILCQRSLVDFMALRVFGI